VLGLCWTVLCGAVYSEWWVCVGLYCVVLCTVSGGFVLTVLCGAVYSELWVCVELYLEL